MGKSRNVATAIAEMERMTAGELRQKHAELFGEESRSGNRQWLFRRCAWRLQALAEGDLSERAHTRAKQLARDVDFRLRPPAEMDMASLPHPADIKRSAKNHIRCFRHLLLLSRLHSTFDYPQINNNNDIKNHIPCRHKHLTEAQLT